MIAAEERTRLRHAIDHAVRVRAGLPILAPEQVSLSERAYEHLAATGGATLKEVQSALATSERSTYRACASLRASGRIVRRRVGLKVVYYQAARP